MADKHPPPRPAGAGEVAPTQETYDIIIVGAGIAGLSAAIYTTRERLSTLVLERQLPGGQILLTARVENYPGFPEPINGMELADRLTQQAKRFGARIETGADPEEGIEYAYHSGSVAFAAIQSIESGAMVEIPAL